MEKRKNKLNSKRKGIETPRTRTSTKEPRFVALTLAWCNRWRKKKGKPALEELPRGVPNDPRSCPCGEATGLYVETGVHIDYADNATERRNPQSVTKFIKAFDSGQLPQYEL